MNKKAFTLIELLIVIAITGILATVILVAYGNSQARARDSKRIGDLGAISSAVKLFYDENRVYPRVDVEDGVDPTVTDPCVSRIRSVNSSRWSHQLVNKLGKHISTPVVVDPINNVSDGSTNKPIWQETDTEAYYYTFLSTKVSYVLAARMENFDRGNYTSLGKSYVSPPKGVSPDFCKGVATEVGMTVTRESFAVDKVIGSDNIGYYFIGANLK
ncbi:MAG: Fimbrial protein precursor [bacterium ADurb.Bin212]|nr:MAG: Fimbrial protein precursor [bacterium ADurb.Bin212]